jgi:hypothetical protein
VRSSACPAAGPVSRIGVCAVIRRLNRRRRDICQAPERRMRSISTTDMPCAIIAMSRCSGVVSAGRLDAGEHQLLVGVLVVDHQQRAVRASPPRPGKGSTVT